MKRLYLGLLIALIQSSPSTAATFLKIEVSGEGVGRELIGSPTINNWSERNFIAGRLIFTASSSSNDATFGSIFQLGTVAFGRSGLNFRIVSPMGFLGFSGQGNLCFDNPTAGLPIGSFYLNSSCSTFSNTSQGKTTVQTFSGLGSELRISEISRLEEPSFSGFVPEPSTWMTLIAGFLVMGYTLRRSRKLYLPTQLNLHNNSDLSK